MFMNFTTNRSSEHASEVGIRESMEAIKEIPSVISGRVYGDCSVFFFVLMFSCIAFLLADEKYRNHFGQNRNPLKR